MILPNSIDDRTPYQRMVAIGQPSSHSPATLCFARLGTEPPIDVTTQWQESRSDHLARLPHVASMKQMNRSRRPGGRLEIALGIEIGCRRVDHSSLRQRIEFAFDLRDLIGKLLEPQHSVFGFRFGQNRSSLFLRLGEPLAELWVTGSCPNAIGQVLSAPADRSLDRIK